MRPADSDDVIDRFYGLGASLLKAGSLVACLIVVISFAIFATDQLGSAANGQAAQIGGPDPTAAALAAGTTVAGTPAPTAAPHQTTLRKVITRAGQRLTAPFTGFVGSSTSQWLVHSVEAALALLVYGFGMGYLARLLRFHG